MRISNKILTTIFIFCVSNAIASFFMMTDTFAEVIASSSEKDIDQYQTNIKNTTTITEDSNNSSGQNNLTSFAILYGLNKINAKTSELRVKIGDRVNFGSLFIQVKKCWKSPPDQRPENKILLRITEIGADRLEKTIFYGWMFSSSPSVSGLEHPIYDITAISCQLK